MKKEYPFSAITAVLLSFASLTLPTISDLHAADIFTKVTAGDVGSESGESRGAAWGDYDNDGYIDLVLVNINQTNHLFHNNGDGTFAAVSNAVVVSDSRGRELGRLQ